MQIEAREKCLQMNRKRSFGFEKILFITCMQCMRYRFDTILSLRLLCNQPFFHLFWPNAPQLSAAERNQIEVDRLHKYISHCIQKAARKYSSFRCGQPVHFNLVQCVVVVVVVVVDGKFIWFCFGIINANKPITINRPNSIIITLNRNEWK